MPNWCQNWLIIKGDQASLDEFYEFNKSDEEELNFAKSVPAEDTVDSHTDMWGTKWTCAEIEIDKSQNNIIEYFFETAWSPPNLWLEKVGKLYKNLEFTLSYQEDGCDYSGMIIYENGEGILDSWDDYDNREYGFGEREIICEECDEVYECGIRDFIHDTYDEYIENKHSIIEYECCCKCHQEK